MTLTDAEVRDQAERALAFREQLRDAIAATVIDDESLCADAQRKTLRRISETLDDVSIVTFANLANIDAAINGLLLDLLSTCLMACGAGPDLDYADAAAFLRSLDPVSAVARKRQIN